MDEKTQELIALGAAVAAHCQPCVTFHVDKAKSMGLSEAEIQEAVAVGESVLRGADAAIRKHVRATLGGEIPTSSCCKADDGATTKKSCCH